MEKKEKKGFFASLFASKPCNCASQIEEIKEEKPQEQSTEQQHNSDQSTKAEPSDTPKCSCGGNC